MPTPFPSRQAAPTSWSGAATTKPTTSNSEWRCTRCDKLLGVCRELMLLPDPSAVAEMMSDYAVMREQSRKCASP